MASIITKYLGSILGLPSIAVFITFIVVFIVKQGHAHYKSISILLSKDHVNHHSNTPHYSKL